MLLEQLFPDPFVGTQVLDDEAQALDGLFAERCPLLISSFEDGLRWILLFAQLLRCRYY